MGAIGGRTVGKSVVAERTVGKEAIGIVLRDREPLVRKPSVRERSVRQGDRR